MKRERFKGTLLSGHKEDAVEVPFDPAERWAMPAKALWPGRRGHLVRGSVNDVVVETAIVGRSTRFWLLVPSSVTEAAGLTVGDMAHVEIELVAEAPAAPRAAGKPKPTSAASGKATSAAKPRARR